MDYLIEAAKAEERKLLAKLSAIRNLLTAYELDGNSDHKILVRDDTNENVATRASSISDVAKSRVIRNAKKADSLTSRAEAAAIAYLKDKGTRAQSHEILKAVISQGVEFAMKNPVATLSSILSNSPEFDNVRGVGKGYGLAEWRKLVPIAPEAEGQKKHPSRRISAHNAQVGDSSGPAYQDQASTNEVESATLLGDGLDGSNGQTDKD